MACIGLDNRWLVTLSSSEARDYLLQNGLSLFNKKIKTRHYDDVLNDEYVEYQYYEQMQNKLYAGSRQQEQAGDNNDDVDDDKHLPLTDSNRGPPTTPEPPHNAF